MTDTSNFAAPRMSAPAKSDGGRQPTNTSGRGRKLKIAMVVPDLNEPGGVAAVASFIWRLIGANPDVDMRVICLALSSRDSSSLLLSSPATWFRGATTMAGELRGIPVIHVGANFADFETQRMRPRSILKTLIADCDIVQVVAGAPCWAMAVIGTGKPVVAAVATITKFERRRTLALSRGPVGWFRRYMSRKAAEYDERALRLADAVLVMNPVMLDYATQAARGRNTIVKYAPPGVDTAQFAPLQDRDPQRGHILTVGRLDDPRKNTDLLLAAYADLTNRTPSAPDLVLAGATGPGPAFWSKAQGLGLAGRIRYIEKPSHAELCRLYREAAMFVSSSDEEGFGFVVVEAMASGIPVVATRSGGPDGIISDGVDGFLVDLNDASGLADRMCALATDADLNRRIGRSARHTAESRYSEAAASAAYLAIYDEVLAAAA